MTDTEDYREHIVYTFHAYCKIVIRHAAIDTGRQRQKRRDIDRKYGNRQCGLATGIARRNRRKLKRRTGTAKFFTLLLLLYRTSAKNKGMKQLISCGLNARKGTEHELINTEDE